MVKCCSANETKKKNNLHTIPQLAGHSLLTRKKYNEGVLWSHTLLSKDLPALSGSVPNMFCHIELCQGLREDIVRVQMVNI